MTNIKEKMTTKTTKLSIITAMVVTLGIIGFVSVYADQTLIDSDITESQIQEITSFKFTEKQESDFKIIAANHPKVASVLYNNDIIFEGVGVAGNLKSMDKKSAVVHYLTSENTISVVIDKETKEITDVEISIPRKMATNNGIAASKYTDNEVIDRLQMFLDVPDYDHQANANYTGIVLNAAKSNSDTANLCDWQNAPEDYWMQSGLVFNEEDGTDVVWTDTISNCFAIHVTSLDWSEGDTLRFRNFITDLSGTANDQVTAFIYNEENADYFSFSRTVENTETFMVDDIHTSVFFENSHDDASESWEDGFPSEEITVSTAEVSTTSNSNYNTWGDSEKEYAHCGGSTAEGQLMDDQFHSLPYSVTWDLLEMRSECYGT